MRDADVLITYGEDLTPEMVKRAEHLKWIMVISAGLDRLPFSAIKEKGIMVTNARGIHKIPMAEYVFAAILQWAKKTKKWNEQQANHHWDKYGVKMEEITGQPIAIIGAGAIGGEIARLAKAFRMPTYGVNRSGRPAEYIDHMFKTDRMNEALKEAKYVVAVLPQTKETVALIGRDQFRAMRKDALFINIGRGKTVDQAALLEALKTGEIAGAVLDVFEEEPLDPGHPFWDMENVTVTPHFSSITSEYQPRALAIFEQNLDAYLAGRRDLINLIDLDRGY